MKIAVKIDYEKLSKIKEKIKEKDYLDNAINHLAYEISTMFYS